MSLTIAPLGPPAGALGLALLIGALVLLRRGSHRAATALVVAGGLALRIPAATDPSLHDWDERFHALVAKNLIAHPLVPTLYDDPVLPYDYRDWTANHVWVHKQPLPLWAMALSMRVFGVNEIALRLPSLLLSTLAIGLTAAIGAALFTPATGVIAALLHAANGLIIHVTAGRIATDHYDLFHLFFVELAVYLAILSSRRRSRGLDAALGCTIGLAILCKWLTALVVVPLWLALVLRREAPGAIAARLGVIAAACGATFLPWQAYIHRAFPLEAQWEGDLNLRRITEPLDGHRGSWTYYFRVLPRYGTLIGLPIAWFLVQAVRSRTEGRWILPALWFLVPFVFFTFVKTKTICYTMISAPALFLMAAAFTAAVGERVRPRGLRVPVAAALLLLVGISPADLPKALSPSREPARKHYWSAALKRLGEKVPDGKAVFFNTPPIETMFFTSGTAYRQLPTDEQVADLTARGYRVYVVDADVIPEGLRGNTRVTFIVP